MVKVRKKNFEVDNGLFAKETLADWGKKRKNREIFFHPLANIMICLCAISKTLCLSRITCSFQTAWYMDTISQTIYLL